LEADARLLTKSNVAMTRSTLVVAAMIFLDESDGFGVKLRESSPRTDDGSRERAEGVSMTDTQARAARAALGLSQPEAAKRLDVGLSLLIAFETGVRQPHAAILRKSRSVVPSLACVSSWTAIDRRSARS
jgi:DNA-binding transcriptional regulator YiaG